MSRFILTLAIIALVAALGCTSSAATSTPRPAVTATPFQLPTATPTQLATPEAEATPAAAPGATATLASFFLEVLAPEDEKVLNTSSVEVLGRTVADAVVSVNDEAVTVNADGTFVTTITLEEGPNVIEVLASDFQDNQKSKVLTVIYVR